MRAPESVSAKNLKTEPWEKGDQEAADRTEEWPEGKGEIRGVHGS